MDIHQALEAQKLTEDQISLSEKYFCSRVKSAEAKKNLDVLLASKYLSAFRENKRNLGYEMALLMLMEVEQEAVKYYEIYITEEAEYKGLEKMIDAIQSKVSFMQSIMKYQIKGEQ